MSLQRRRDAKCLPRLCGVEPACFEHRLLNATILHPNTLFADRLKKGTSDKKSSGCSFSAIFNVNLVGGDEEPLTSYGEIGGDALVITR